MISASKDYRKNLPVFRPPKYTGITLSLLSIFTLVSMMVVWNKITPPPGFSTLRIFAWEECRQPLESARRCFEEETGSLLVVDYLDSSALANRLGPLNPPTEDRADLIISPELAPADDRKSSVFGTEVFRLASRGAPSTASSPGEQVLVGRVSAETAQSASALRFLRYLQAPTKGQFDFAEAGWQGVRGDFWSSHPSLLIYALPRWEFPLHEASKAFLAREEVDARITCMNGESLRETLLQLNRPEGMKFLPDLVILEPRKTSWELDGLPFDRIPLQTDEVALAPAILLGRNCRFPSVANRFLKLFEKRFHEASHSP